MRNVHGQNDLAGTLGAWMPHNNAMDRDTFRYALRAPHGARHRERYAS